MSKYIHRYTPWWKGGGGGGSYDDTAIKRRITALESGKQNVLVGGDGIVLLNDTISAVNILNDTRESSTTVWSSNKVKSLFDTLQGQVDIVITPTKPAKSSAVNKTMYYVGTESPYHIWFFVNDDYTDFGTTELDLSNYFTKAEINELLELKVDKVVGKSLVLDTDIAQITTNKNDIANIKDDETITSFGKVKLEFDKKVDKETGKSLVSDTDITQITTNKTDIATLQTDKQDKITDSTLDSLTDSTTVSSVSASSKTNKTFALSKLWTWIVGKLTSNTEKGIQISSGKLGHSNAITVPTAKRILQATYDAQGHVTNIQTEFNWSNNYLNSAENQLFTRKGANDMYTNYLKSTNGTLTKKSVVTNDYSHYVKCGNIYQLSIGFNNDSTIAKNAELYTLPASIASASIEMYIVISTVTGDTRVLQCGGGAGASKLCAKDAIPSGYWFGSAIFIKV